MTQCIAPLSLPRPKGRGSSDRIEVPCNKCLHCLSNKRDEWSFRLKQEQKISKSSFFLTLTYNEENLPIHSRSEVDQDGYIEIVPELNKKHFVDFIKRLRKTNYPKSAKVAYNSPETPTVRYYAVGEYGTETFRPHYHAIIFNLTEKTQLKLADIWQKGHVQLDPCNSASIHYVTKYVITKNTDYGLRQKPFALMSRMPGLGANYLSSAMKKYHKANQEFTVHSGQGNKINIPKYFKEKIFSKTEIIKKNYENEIHRLKTEKKQIAHLIKTGYNESYEHFMFTARHKEITNLEKRLNNKKNKL